MGQGDIEREMDEIRKRRSKPAEKQEPEAGALGSYAVDEAEEIAKRRGERPGQRPGQMEMAAPVETPTKAEEPAAPTETGPQVEQPAAQPEAEEPRIYVVKKGDNLSKISQEVYGNAGRWREIYEANRDQIKDPNLIRPGWKLRIP